MGILNINIIINIITKIFYYSNNSVLFFGIIFGILIKTLIDNKNKHNIKKVSKFIIFIIIDIIKIFLIKYNLVFIIISLLISLFFINYKPYKNQIFIKIFLHIIYIIFPISSYQIVRSIYNNNLKILYTVPTFIYIFITNYKVLLTSSYKNIVICILMMIISYYFYNNKNKKRNIIIIFLLILYLIYYLMLP